MAMPRCVECKQIYSGPYHVNCPGHQLKQAVLVADSPVVTGAPTSTDETMLPQPQAAANTAQVPRVPATVAPTGKQAISPTATIASVMASEIAGVSRDVRSQTNQLPATVQPPGATAIATIHVSSPNEQLTPNNQRRGLVRSADSDLARRPINGPALGSLVGLGLITWWLILFNPILILLVVVVAYARRQWLFRVVLPRGMVSVWNCTVYDPGQRILFMAHIYDPEGVPPEIGAQVLLRGRQQGRLFVAHEMICEADARGNAVLQREGLVSRQMPPVWFSVMLLLIGIMLHVPFVFNTFLR